MSLGMLGNIVSQRWEAYLTVLGSTVFVILFLQLRTWTIMLDARTVPGTGIVVGQYLVLREM